MGLVTFNAAAIATATTGVNATSDIHVVGTHYVQGVNVYFANANSGGQRFTLTAPAAAEYVRKLAMIARGDYVIIKG